MFCTMGAHQSSVGDTQGVCALLTESGERADRRASHRRVKLVVVEAGAAGLAGCLPPDEMDHTVVTVQSDNHTPAEAVRGSISRIQALEHGGHSIELTILMLAPRFDIETTAARVALARALATHSATTNSGSSEILLSARGSTLHRYQQAGLLALVDVLTSEPGSWSLPVRVQFVDAVRPGVRFRSREVSGKPRT
jgi:hypothetical protein